MQRSCKPLVVGSNPTEGSRLQAGVAQQVERLTVDQDIQVQILSLVPNLAGVAQLVECARGKREVVGTHPTAGPSSRTCRSSNQDPRLLSEAMWVDTPTRHTIGESPNGKAAGFDPASMRVRLLPPQPVSYAPVGKRISHQPLKLAITSSNLVRRANL